MCIYYFINFRSHQFFSLFSFHNDLSSSSYFPQMHINTPTHKHIHTDKSTQKHTHSQTNPHRQTNKEIDRCLWSLVHGSAGEQVIWVVELGSWIGRWRKDLCRGAWFVDRPVKKESGSVDEEVIWVGSFWERMREDRRERERKRERERGDLFRKNE